MYKYLQSFSDFMAEWEESEATKKKMFEEVRIQIFNLFHELNTTIFPVCYNFSDDGEPSTRDLHITYKDVDYQIRESKAIRLVKRHGKEELCRVSEGWCLVHDSFPIASIVEHNFEEYMGVFAAMCYTLDAMGHSRAYKSVEEYVAEKAQDSLLNCPFYDIFYVFEDYTIADMFPEKLAIYELKSKYKEVFEEHGELKTMDDCIEHLELFEPEINIQKIV